MTKRRGMWLVPLALACAGCSNFTPTKRAIVQADIDYILKTQLNFNNPRQATEGFRAWVDEYDRLSASSPGRAASAGIEARKRELRDRIIMHVLAHIGAYHEANYDDLYEQVASVETFTDAVVLGTGAVGSFAAETTSQIMSAVSAGVVGLRASAQVNFLNDMNKFVVLVRMSEIRAQKLELVYAGMKKDTTTYPLHIAARHLQDLLDQGSIRDAASKDATKAVADLNTALEKLQERERQLTEDSLQDPPTPEPLQTGTDSTPQTDQQSDQKNPSDPNPQNPDTGSLRKWLNQYRSGPV